MSTLAINLHAVR